MLFPRKKELLMGNPPANWRSYQTHLQRRERLRNTRKRMAIWLLLLMLLFTAGYLLHRGINVLAHLTPEPSPAPPPSPPQEEMWDRGELKALLQGESFLNRTRSQFEIQHGPDRFRGATTLDPQLQQDLVDELNTWMAKDRYQSRYVGIVALDPGTGKILGFAGHDKLAGEANPCLNSQFPAASIFKIVTAAAAIEAGRMTQNTQLAYNGRPHTLYKSQIKETRNKYTRHLTLKEAFAKSINPVFGKLGANQLGKDNLAKYAQTFAFNQSIPWELALPPSQFSIDDEPYHWAEIASGFNKETTLSPLHGALISAALVNEGALMVPNLVETLVDPEGKVIYRARPSAFQQAIAPATAHMLASMMEATITSGTGRKAFRGHRKDEVLSRLRLGGKTGTINNDPRYDWYVGFARDKQGSEQLAVSVVVAHEKYIGQRAAEYAKLAIKSHFSRYFRRQANPASPGSAPRAAN